MTVHIETRTVCDRVECGKPIDDDGAISVRVGMTGLFAALTERHYHQECAALLTLADVARAEREQSEPTRIDPLADPLLPTVASPDVEP